MIIIIAMDARKEKELKVLQRIVPSIDVYRFVMWYLSSSSVVSEIFMSIDELDSINSAQRLVLKEVQITFSCL